MYNRFLLEGMLEPLCLLMEKGWKAKVLVNSLRGVAGKYV
jgi:hypothetical protein